LPLKERDAEGLQNILTTLWVIALMLVGFYLMIKLHDTSRVI
jgi:hypothetical protein